MDTYAERLASPGEDQRLVSPLPKLLRGDTGLSVERLLSDPILVGSLL